MKIIFSLFFILFSLSPLKAAENTLFSYTPSEGDYFLLDQKLSNGRDCPNISTPPTITTPSLSPLNGTSLSGYLLIGEKIWSIIKNNHAVNECQSKTIDILPTRADNSPYTQEELSNWQGPKYSFFQFETPNILISYRFVLSFSYGGGVNGVGQYLKGVTILPLEGRIGSPYKFHADVYEITHYNAGTAENPMMKLLIGLKIEIEKMMSSQISTYLFEMSGNGDFRKIEE